MSEPASLSAARSWHEAMNARDAERLVALAHDDVEVEDPRGRPRAEMLRAWLTARPAGRLHLIPAGSPSATLWSSTSSRWRNRHRHRVARQEVWSVLVVREARGSSRHPDLGALPRRRLAPAEFAPG